ncbi:MAG TPA: hypothetical protein GXX36_13185 [Clostridiaceae bacterium]|nr:hypothetical protein [Clostridiaceae bacterium]
MTKKYKISLMDGVRVDFPYGWLLVRKSVTEEGITIRIEAKNEENMNKIKSLILEVLTEIPEELLL